MTTEITAIPDSSEGKQQQQLFYVEHLALKFQAIVRAHDEVEAQLQIASIFARFRRRGAQQRRLVIDPAMFFSWWPALGSLKRGGR